MCKKCHEGIDQILNGKDKAKCTTCKGDGIYKYGPIVNNRPSKQGKCFACAGKGFVNKSDILRRNSYYNHRIKLYA